MTALAGCRVLDLGIITAGAATATLLADLGAEVIKIESPSYADPFRKWTGETHPDEHPDLPPFFRMTNRGKRNAGIDLKTPAGRAVFLRLVAASDVVVENFSRGVLQRLGLDFAALQAANPDIILASISSQGEDGPEAAYVSFGSTLEAMAGLSAITGYAGGPPVCSGIELNYPDQVVALFAAAMIATAWHARGTGVGGGVLLDLSQRELTSFLCGESFATPETAVRRGNADETALFQDCLRTADGSWLAATVALDQASALGELAGGAAHLADWAAERSRAEALCALAAAGIAAAPVLDGAETLAERDAGWSYALHLLADGETVKGMPFATAGEAMPDFAPAALLGTHTRAVLREVGGYDDAEIDALLAEGAVAEAS